MSRIKKKKKNTIVKHTNRLLVNNSIVSAFIYITVYWENYICLKYTLIQLVIKEKTAFLILLQVIFIFGQFYIIDIHMTL